MSKRSSWPRGPFSAIWRPTVARPDRYPKTSSPRNFASYGAALRLIRETVEEMAPPGSVPNDEYLTAEPMREAEAIRGIHAIADPTR